MYIINGVEQEAGAGSDTTAIHDNVASEISAITEKSSPADADLVLIEDSAASNVKKKVQVGNLGGGLFSESANNNVVGGDNAGAALSSGQNCFYGGDSAGRYPDGSQNVGIGTQALEGTDSNNFSRCIGIGYQVGLALTTGSDNVLIGDKAGDALTSGSANVAIGTDALGATLVGLRNVGIGYQVALNNGSVTRCVLIGYTAGKGASDSLFTDCIAIGYEAGLNYKSAGNNVALGDYALRAGAAGTSGVGRNVGIGSSAGYSITSGSRNTFLGYKAGYAVTTPTGNVCIGYQAGDNITTGGENIIIGYDINAPSATADDQFLLGNSSYNFLRGDMANFTLAINGANGYLNFNTTLGSGGYGIRDNAGTMEFKDSGGSWTTFASLSDIRLKDNIQGYSLGLNFIQRLRPVEFNFKSKPNLVQHGLIAQEVKAVMDDLGIEFGGWYRRPDDLQGLNYDMFIVPLINAVKELKKELDDFKSQAHN